jgi:hypothetical protein
MFLLIAGPCVQDHEFSQREIEGFPTRVNPHRHSPEANQQRLCNNNLMRAGSTTAKQHKCVGQRVKSRAATAA